MAELLQFDNSFNSILIPGCQTLKLRAGLSATRTALITFTVNA
jgi:hypothetical protein